MDFELFRPELSAALSYTDRTEDGRPPFDPVLMFKILVIQATNNLSDERAEFLINDRLSFMRFLGLGLEDRVPDARTIFLAEGDTVELVEHSFVEALANAVRLRALSFSARMIDVRDGEVEFVVVSLRVAAILAAAIGEHGRGLYPRLGRGSN